MVVSCRQRDAVGAGWESGGAGGRTRAALVRYGLVARTVRRERDLKRPVNSWRAATAGREAAEDDAGTEREDAGRAERTRQVAGTGDAAWIDGLAVEMPAARLKEAAVTGRQ